MSEIFTIRPMELSDIRPITALERQVFTMPWPSFVYVHEISQNELSYMGLIEAGTGNEIDKTSDNDLSKEENGWLKFNWLHRRQPESARNIAAYGGVWLDGSSGHISVIASSPHYRRKGFGELMLIALIGRAITRGMKRMLLEVRVSNVGAQTLYQKYGFGVHETLHDYYHDNGEDAYVMVTPDFTKEYYEMLRTNASRLRQSISFVDHYSEWIE